MRSIVTAIVGGIVGAALVTGVAETYRAKHPPKPRTVYVMAEGDSKGPAASVQAIRRAERTWPEIAQAEVDKLTEALKAVPEAKRRPVVIFCQNDDRCGDLALNLENALESAHWTVTKEQPLADQTVGLGVTEPDMLPIIAGATSLEPKIAEANLGDKIGIVIGRRPKS